ncbi:nitroreductase family deazaflavin-dependent oxidoreductase [Kribbella antibiotica]|uniref:Nitroreductase family deazaflavin-dependent oxidoreductase n=2 Tax=Kribbella antibiotica TaxID=190195 RepID=A0A4R4ZMM9_9ACTN|nr:nitroreductase family deazaflavin-dependent oxidoreductase [Kribbella antibiotica]
MSDINQKVIADFRANNGTVTIEPFAGGPIVLLHHVGAKTGTARVTPLAYDEVDGQLFIIASKAGTPENPAWYHNLLANPETTIEFGPDTIAVTAEALTEGEERARLYKHIADKMPNFAEYQKKTDRLIPVVLLHRK